MLKSWLKPPQAKVLNLREQLPTGSFGNAIPIFGDPVDILPLTSKVVFIGLDEAEADAIRMVLYPLSWQFPENCYVDLGNVQNPDPSTILPHLSALLESSALPVLIGRNAHWMLTQLQAYLPSTSTFLNCTSIDERIRWLPGGDNANNYPFNWMLGNGKKKTYTINTIGAQAHYILPEQQQIKEQFCFDWMRLGAIRKNIANAEPWIRDADLLCLHLSALKWAEAPAQEMPNPSGLTSEEACQLCRYAGLSDKLTSLGIYGFVHEKTQNNRSAQVIAQMLWYFLNGFVHRKNDYPASNAGMTEYIVNHKKLNAQLVFWKSVRSGRWWMQIPGISTEKEEWHRLIPCTYEDYLETCQDEFPERLLRALKNNS